MGVQRRRGSTHHGRDGEQLNRQRRHRHHTLMVVLHKICLKASVVLEGGTTFHRQVKGHYCRPTSPPPLTRPPTHGHTETCSPVEVVPRECAISERPTHCLTDKLSPTHHHQSHDRRRDAQLHANCCNHKPLCFKQHWGISKTSHHQVKDARVTARCVTVLQW